MITKENEKALKTIPEVPLCKYLLEPLLKAMGYDPVIFLGGAEEFGVDIYFCKPEPTGKAMEYAAIVERRNIHKQAGKRGVIHDLLQHIREVLRVGVKISTPEYEQVRNVHMIWIITSNKITEPAKEYIRNEIEKDLVFRNLQFYDGKDLLNWIDKYLPDVLRSSYFAKSEGFPMTIWEKDKYEILERLRLGEPEAKHELLGKDFIGEKLQGRTFEGATMMGSKFVRSDLTKSNFIGAALMGADFSLASLCEANLTQASCMGAYFNGTDMRGIILRDAALMGAQLRKAICTDADLRGAALMGAKLEGVDLKRSNLEGAFLNQAMLNEADLRQIKVRNTDFTKAELKGADLREIEFDDSTMKTICRSYNWEKAKLAPDVMQNIKLLSISINRVTILESSLDPSKVVELKLKCKTCGVWFGSGIAMSQLSFQTTMLSGNVHQCPNGHKHAYNKEDYKF